jgi:hypothetical protein
MHASLLMSACVLHTIDHMEPEPKEVADQAPEEGTNPKQGKPRCISRISSCLYGLN